MGDCDAPSDCEEGSSVGQCMTNGGDPSLSRVLEALADTRSRYLCHYVVENEPCDIEECADAVAAWETGTEPAAVPEERHRHVKTSLFHNHLPKLRDLGIVEYDERTGDIRCQHLPPHLEKLLTVVRKLETN